MKLLEAIFLINTFIIISDGKINSPPLTSKTFKIDF